MEIQLGPWRVRDFHARDHAALVRHANNPRIARHMRDRFPYPYTDADATAWLGFVREQVPCTNFAIASESELIGGVGLMPGVDIHRRSAELGYWLAETHWGRGIAAAVARAVTTWAFQELDLVRVYATVFENNPASARVLEKAGFVFEGRLRKSVTKHGVLLDELLYASVRPDVK